MFKIIELFNHKGGVSKTTSTFHIAWKLTQHNKKVLVVDGDPQCNLTGLFLDKNFDNYYEEESTCHNNIKDAVSMAFEGRPMPIQAIECPQHPNNKDLYLIPGHMDLSAYESSLSLAMTSNNAIVTLQNLPGSFYRLIAECCKKYDIDYVLIDMNPGLTALNETFFIYSDAFIVPVNPDPFSIMSLKTLSSTLPKWKRWADNNVPEFSDASYPLPSCNAKFVGEIIQRFNIRNKKPAKTYSGKIEEIKTFIEDNFVPELSKENMVYSLDKLVSEGIVSGRCLGEVSDYASLIQRANEALLPVFSLDRETMNATGSVYEQMEIKRTMFDEIYDRIVKIILVLLDTDNQLVKM